MLFGETAGHLYQKDQMACTWSARARSQRKGRGGKKFKFFPPTKVLGLWDQSKRRIFLTGKRFFYICYLFVHIIK